MYEDLAGIFDAQSTDIRDVFLSGPNTRVNIGSEDSSQNIVNITPDDLFRELRASSKPRCRMRRHADAYSSNLRNSSARKGRPPLGNAMFGSWLPQQTMRPCLDPTSRRSRNCSCGAELVRGTSHWHPPLAVPVELVSFSRAAASSASRFANSACAPPTGLLSPCSHPAPRAAPACRLEPRIPGNLPRHGARRRSGDATKCARESSSA
jgi:hypothetical protein